MHILRRGCERDLRIFLVASRAEGIFGVYDAGIVGHLDQHDITITGVGARIKF